MEGKEITVGEWLKDGVKIGDLFIPHRSIRQYKVVVIDPFKKRIIAVSLKDKRLTITFCENDKILPLVPHG